MVILKSLQEIVKIHRACLILADVLTGIREMVRPGVTTLSLDESAERFIRDAGGKPAFKGYRGYPRSLTDRVDTRHTVR